MADAHIDDLVDFMLEESMLIEDQGMLSIGEEAERAFGRRHFMELMSVFTSDPLVSVWHGRSELGVVHPVALRAAKEGPLILLLGGRSWQLNQVDWVRRRAYVEATHEKGRTRWMGTSTPLRFELCRAVASALRSDGPSVLSRRAHDKHEELRSTFSWLPEEGTSLIREADGTVRWWTFAGLLANSTLGELLGPLLRQPARPENFSIRLQDRTTIDELRLRLGNVRNDDALIAFSVDDDALQGMKFSECLPLALAHRVLAARSSDADSVRTCLSQRIESTSLADDRGST